MGDPMNDYDPTQPGPEPCLHRWRVVNCRADGVDELECADCHETTRCACTFDEDYS